MKACKQCATPFDDGKNKRSFCSIDCYLSHYTNKTEQCWNWTGPTTVHDTHRYGLLRIGKTNIRAHRAAWAKQNAQTIPSGLYVLHECDNTLCVNPAHLRLGLPKMNSEDMAKRGRSTRGEKNPQAKLTSAQVEEIRMLAWTATKQQKELAKEYGVSRSAVSLICRGSNWKHL